MSRCTQGVSAANLLSKGADASAWFELRDGAQRTAAGRAARHVCFHLLHILARFDRDAARVERDALADEGPEFVLLARAFRFITHDDERGRLVRTLPDA